MEDVVIEEIGRLKKAWSRGRSNDGESLLVALMGDERAAALDLFDRVQLAAVIRICRDHSSLSTAGRALFAASRAQKASANDADRLRKYLARFDLDWRIIAAPA